ncbi:MAG: membrane dipeptidase, partial [Ruminococcaceae bacterium]|nr:membrane dipeptidase [Oscillospiraceae bacterium]
RNLTDHQFTQIVKTGGVAGINFYPPFLGDSIACVKDHIDRFLSLGGEDSICLGSDFDGVDCLPCGINDVSDMDKVVNSLPYSTEVREKIAFKNILRVIKAHNC